MTTAATNTYITPVLLLCVTCQSAIRAWINSCQWIRCEWISPSGECVECNRKGKEAGDGSRAK